MKGKVAILIIILLTLAGGLLAWFWMQHLLDNYDLSSTALALKQFSFRL
ncbi:hypothetical protein [Lentibacillus sediminis]|nr:hypothetical protein [Lentibacillus sediminis]